MRLSHRARIAVAFLAGVYVVLLAYATLTPADTAEGVTGVVAVIAASVAAALGSDPDATYAMLEVAANVALFIPFGMLVAAPRASAPRHRAGRLREHRRSHEPRHRICPALHRRPLLDHG